MRKILFILATITLMTVGVNAQVMEIYNGSILIKTYTQEQADRVVFEEAPAIINVTSITVTGSKKELNVGESLQLSATISPSNATNKSVTWSSSNTSVATVSSSGLVKAVKAGSVTITATAQDGSGVKGTYAMTITNPTVNVTSITVIGSKKELNVGESLQLSATVSPSNATNKSVTWSSSNTSVATVSSSGLVKAVKAGSVTITATAQDGSGVKGTYMIMVSSASNTHNGHEYVDLGLSVKWATCNVGASKPEDYGYYFAWGETIGYSQDINDGHKFDWANYKWYNGSYDTMTKYCTSSSYGTVDNKTTLELSDDAAYKNWGGSWRMPTKTEQDELKTKCTWVWTTQNGVKGYKVTGPNGNYIFLPAAGGRIDGGLYRVESDGFYWSSSLDTSNSSSAYGLSFDSGTVYWYIGIRFYGNSVRAVCP